MPSKELTKYPAQDIADKFGVHVKTIARAVTNNPNASDWDVAPITGGDLCKAFKMDINVFTAVMVGKDQLIDAENAAKMLGITVRRFHQRRATSKDIKTAASHGRTVRYSYTAIATAGL